MSSIVIKGNTSGQIELAAPDVAGSTTLTMPTTDGTVITNNSAVGDLPKGPAFSLVKTSHQTISTATNTLVTFDSIEFDVTSDADLTNNRVVPSVEGYYLIDFNFRFSGITDGGQILSYIYKNGSEIKRGMQYNNGAAAGAHGNSTHLLYFNGTTDYLNVYIYQNTGANKNLISGSQYTTLSGLLVRGA